MDFFKRCPRCGRRFVVARKARTLVDRETAVQKEMHFAGAPDPYGRAGSSWVATEDDVPVEYDTFRIEYVCKHCQHSWSESSTAARRT